MLLPRYALLKLGTAVLLWPICATACDIDRETTPKFPGQDRITPAIVKRLVGTWYVDHVEHARFMGQRLNLSREEIELAVAQTRESFKSDPPEVWITVYSNGQLRWPHAAAALQLAVFDYAIGAPGTTGGCAKIYSIAGRFYHGSREHVIIPMTNKRPR